MSAQKCNSTIRFKLAGRQIHVMKLSGMLSCMRRRMKIVEVVGVCERGLLDDSGLNDGLQLMPCSI